ncbi:hypothetical protein GCM10022255_106560 [Dactylosporangium darangshiense]|uniref:Uncharacterized protein n=1 Tax=Dactylosporangium darangshiense TaxID=579108 RepID=A0ABP8DTI7_9ACTN
MAHTSVVSEPGQRFGFLGARRQGPLGVHVLAGSYRSPHAVLMLRGSGCDDHQINVRMRDQLPSGIDDVRVAEAFCDGSGGVLPAAVYRDDLIVGKKIQNRDMTT